MATLVATVTCAALLIAFLGERAGAAIIPPDAVVDVGREGEQGSLDCGDQCAHNKLFIVNSNGYQCIANAAGGTDMKFTMCFSYIDDMSGSFLTENQLTSIRDHVVFANVAAPNGGIPLYAVCNNVHSVLSLPENKGKLFAEVFAGAESTIKTWEQIEFDSDVEVYYERKYQNGTKTYQRAGMLDEKLFSELPEGTTCAGTKTHFLKQYLVYKCERTNDPESSPVFDGCAYGNVGREAQSITYLKMKGEDKKFCALHDYAAYVEENDPKVLDQFCFERAADAAENQGPAICKKLSEADQPIDEYNKLTQKYKLDEISVEIANVAHGFFPM